VAVEKIFGRKIFSIFEIHSFTGKGQKYFLGGNNAPCYKSI
jgi:hypothetical protein